VAGTPPFDKIYNEQRKTAEDGKRKMGFWIWILEWGFGNYIRLYFYYYYLFLIYIYDLWAWLET